MPLLHPDVAVRLGHAGLRVQERHKDAALCTQTGIVAMTLFHSILVILLAQSEMQKMTTDYYYWRPVEFTISRTG